MLVQTIKFVNILNNYGLIDKWLIVNYPTFLKKLFTIWV